MGGVVTRESNDTRTAMSSDLTDLQRRADAGFKNLADVLVPPVPQFNRRGVEPILGAQQNDIHRLSLAALHPEVIVIGRGYFCFDPVAGSKFGIAR